MSDPYENPDLEPARTYYKILPGDEALKLLLIDNGQGGENLDHAVTGFKAALRGAVAQLMNVPLDAHEDYIQDTEKHNPVLAFYVKEASDSFKGNAMQPQRNAEQSQDNTPPYGTTVAFNPALG